VERTESSYAADMPETGPSFVESPMTRIWLQADSTRGVDIDAVTRLQEKLAATESEQRTGRRWLRARR
jgi:hypothetical protein